MGKQANRWLYLILATVSFLFLGMLYAWSIFRVNLTKIFTDWTVTQMSLTFTISMITFCGGSILGGQLFRKFQSRTIFLLSAVLLFAGFLGASYLLKPDNSSGSLLTLYVFYGGFCGLGVGIGYNSVMSTLVRWFPDKAGLASGVMLMGFGGGGLVLGNMVNLLSQSIGLFLTFRIIAVAVAIVLSLAAIIVRKPTSDEFASLQARKAVSGKSAKTSLAVKNVSPAQVLKSSLFWALFAWLIFTNAGGLLVINSAALIAALFTGVAASMGLIVLLFNGAGRLIFGALGDNFGIKVAFLLDSLCLILAGACLFLSVITGNALLMFIGLPLVGLSYGGSPALSSVAANTFWGPENYSTNFSFTNCSVIPAALFGPMISSALLVQSGGAYNSTFVMLTLFGVVALLCGIVIIRKTSSSRRSAQ
ncbi:MAG: MFS transporter [Peptococcaceae bacterium]|jgi:OFA family oxalate/formate antiporter-like MFS transporter|nr:MFS transporter [Peptococcaceae bacterium]